MNKENKQDKERKSVNSSGENKSEKKENVGSQLIDFDGKTFCKYHHFSLLKLDDELDFYSSIKMSFCVFENEEEEFMLNIGDNYELAEDLGSALEIGADYFAVNSLLKKETIITLLSATYEQEDGWLFENNGRMILGVDVTRGEDLDENVFVGMQGILYQSCPSIDIKVEFNCIIVEGKIIEDNNDIMGYSNFIQPPTVALYLED